MLRALTGGPLFHSRIGIAVLASLTALVIAGCGEEAVPRVDVQPAGQIADPDPSPNNLPTKRPQSHFYDVSDLRERIKQEPGVPFVFPTELRDDYQLMRLSGKRTEADGTTYARFYDFAPRPLLDKSATAHVCAIRSGHKDPTQRQLCYDDRGPSSRTLERRSGEMTLVINFDMEPTPADRRYWNETPLTTDLNRVSWLN